MITLPVGFDLALLLSEFTTLALGVVGIIAVVSGFFLLNNVLKKL